MEKLKERGLNLIVLITTIVVVSSLSVIYINYSEDIANIDVYYLNVSKVGIEPLEKKYEANKSKDEIIEEVFQMFTDSTQTAKANLISVKPENVEILEYSIDYSTGILKVNFSQEYKEMTNVEEINFKSAFVWTFTDLEFIKKIEFEIDGYPYTTNSSQVIKYFDRTNVIVEPTIAVDKVVQRDVTLYYGTGNKDGRNNLIVEHRAAVTKESTPIEEVVVVELFKGSEIDGYVNLIPSDVTIRSIKRENSICFIDLDDKFLKGKLTEHEQALRVYSLVNTLTELYNVDKVQILINAKKTKGFEDIDISKPLKRNEYYIG